MPRNLIIKHDAGTYVHPSSTRNETRRDIVEHRVRKGISGQKEKCLHGWRDWRDAVGFEFYATITPVILYLRRADTSFRSTSHYMTYGVHDGSDEAIDREEDERAN